MSTHRPVITCVQVSLAVAGMILGAGSLCLADIIHVAPCGHDDWKGANANCASPAGPKRTIQAAIEAAAHGDTIILADGVYTGPGNRNLDFGGRAIVLRSKNGPAACIIDGEHQHRAMRFHGGETAGSIVEGITFRNGRADFGGAVLCEGSSPAFIRCIFEDNTAFPGSTGGEGGAIRSVGGSPEFTDCSFLRNEAMRIAGIGGRGGGIQFIGGSPVLMRCTFEENTAGGGGGVHSTAASNPTLIDCDFTGNWTADPTFNGGGGYLASLGGHVTFVGCSFVENQTARIAGAIWITQGVAATITRCTFSENYGFDAGCVGVANGSHAVITSSIFANNTADIFSSALEVWNGPPTGAPASAHVRNCTFSGNATSAGYGTITLLHTSSVAGSNNILWGNTPVNIVALNTSTVDLTYSNIEGGWSGAGNIDADPLFLAGSCTPGPGSPGIDAGDPAFAPDPCEHDVVGACRRWIGESGTNRVDMGAVESQSPRGDLNSDCRIDNDDLTILALNMNLTGATYAQGDLDGNGVVDAADLKLLAMVMGTRCP